MDSEYCIIDDFNEKFVDIPEINENDDNYINNFDENILIFDAHIYFDNILKSYNNNYTNVHNQLLNDYHRFNIQLNNASVNYDEFMKFITKYNKNMLITLTTQASFFLSFYMMYKIYSSNNIIIKDASIKKIINFYTIKEKLIIKFNLMVNLFDIFKEEILQNINTELVVELNENILNKCGILSWNVENNML
jgi:hypothetical protein